MEIGSGTVRLPAAAGSANDGEGLQRTIGCGGCNGCQPWPNSLPPTDTRPGAATRLPGQWLMYGRKISGGHREINDQPRDIDQRRHERRGTRRRIEPEEPQDERQHRARQAAPADDADQRHAHRHRQDVRVRAVSPRPNPASSTARCAGNPPRPAATRATGRSRSPGPPPATNPAATPRPAPSRG